MDFLPTPRSALKTVVVEDKICAIGGWNRDFSRKYLTNVEVYDPLTDSWETKANMQSGNRNFCVESVDGKIYVMRDSTEVEMYDPITNIWSEESMTPVEIGNGSGVVDGEIYVLVGPGPILIRIQHGSLIQTREHGQILE